MYVTGAQERTKCIEGMNGLKTRPAWRKSDPDPKSLKIK